MSRMVSGSWGSSPVRGGLALETKKGGRDQKSRRPEASLTKSLHALVEGAAKQHATFAKSNLAMIVTD